MPNLNWIVAFGIIALTIIYVFLMTKAGEDKYAIGGGVILFAATILAIFLIPSDINTDIIQTVAYPSNQGYIVDNYTGGLSETPTQIPTIPTATPEPTLTPTEEQYDRAIRFIEDGHYSAAFDMLVNLLHHSGVQARLYDLAIDMENKGNYFLAADIYSTLINEGFSDAQARHSHLINGRLPLEFFVGTWGAENIRAIYEVIVFRDGQNHYHFEFHRNPFEPDRHRNQQAAFRGQIDSCTDGKANYHSESWIVRPHNSLAVQFQLSSGFFSKESRNTMSTTFWDYTLVFTRQPE